MKLFAYKFDVERKRRVKNMFKVKGIYLKWEAWALQFEWNSKIEFILRYVNFDLPTVQPNGDSK